MSLLKISAVITIAMGAMGAMSACQPAANTNANTTPAVNTANKNSNANANANANQASNAAADIATSTTVDADTPTEAYNSAYNARKNKDVAALKKLMSKDILEFFQIVADSEGDKKKSLDDVLLELCEKPQAATAETRNEKIKGDRATLEYLDENGAWKTMDFDKVDGAWKLGAPGPDDDAPSVGLKKADKGEKK